MECLPRAGCWQDTRNERAVKIESVMQFRSGVKWTRWAPLRSIFYQHTWQRLTVLFNFWFVFFKLRVNLLTLQLFECIDEWMDSNPIQLSTPERSFRRMQIMFNSCKVLQFSCSVIQSSLSLITPQNQQVCVTWGAAAASFALTIMWQFSVSPVKWTRCLKMWHRHWAFDGC